MNTRIYFSLSLLIGILFPASRLLSQTEFELPEDIEFKTKADYKKYEPTMVAAAAWLTETSLNKEKDTRKDVNKFVIQWIDGSPTVTMQFTTPLLKMFKENPNLLAIYTAYYCKYCIEKQSDANKKEAAKAGLIAVNMVYLKGVGVVKNKTLDKLSKSIEKNTLDKFETDINKI